MSWTEYQGHGQPLWQTACDITACCLGQRGVIEVQTIPMFWERLCQELGSTRPVEIERKEDRVAFVSYVAGRVLRFYALEDMGKSEFRFRVVPT